MNAEIKERVEMIQRGEVPKGYKKTKVGIIPEDWEVKRLGELFNFSGGYPIPRKDLGKKGVSYLHYGDIHTTKKNFINIDEEWDRMPKIDIDVNELNEKYYVYDADIVFVDASEDYEGIGKSITIINESRVPFIAGLHTIVAKDKDKKDLISREYKRYFLSSYNVRKQFMFYATGLSVLGISMDNIKKIVVSLPLIKEQQKIAEILSTWDEAIDLKEKLIEEKQEQKKGLMQNLLTGKVRLPGFEGEVTRIRLKGNIKQIKTKNTKGKINRVLSITNTQGFVKQQEQFDKRVASKNLSNYKIIKKGEFAYNPSRINVGSIDLLTNYDIGVLSPMYIVFETDNKKLLSEYLYQYVKTNEFYEQMKGLVQGSVRESLSFDALEMIKLFIPDLEEQKAIADILSTADREIELLKEEVELLKEQKKGLMQLLLTGIVRVDEAIL